MPTINATKILGQRIDLSRLSHLDRLAVENAMYDAYANGFHAGADWEANNKQQATLTGRI